MELTKNEKRILGFLINNARMPDSEIAEKLGISSQAVGKTRRKLESCIIDSYTANLNYAKLGIGIFAMSIARMTREGLDRGQLEIEHEMMKIPHIIQVFRIPKQSATHIIIYGFRDMEELDAFFYSSDIRDLLHKYVESQELFTFSHNSILKNSPAQLLHKAIEEVSTKTRFKEKKGRKENQYLSQQKSFKEFENFKKRLSHQYNGKRR